MTDRPDPERPATALVLTGGGARAAYQVGVLQAICEVLPNPRINPFPIICGTSAGAINAVSLACHAENFQSAVDAVAGVWRNFRAHHVYRADGLGIAASSLHWLSALAVGWITRRAPRSLLDNAPLERLLTRYLDFNGIDRAIGSGALRAVSVTASGYASGESVSFFQAAGSVEPWRRAQRMGCRTRLGVEHLLASSAIPFVFPAQLIHREYFGDGSMRHLAPMSPAVRMGAQRILIIGSGRIEEPAEQRKRQHHYPSLAQIAGHVMSSIFLDSLPADVEQLERINQLVGRVAPESMQPGETFRSIRTLVITPSERLDDIATRYAGSLPLAVRVLLGGIGGTSRRGGALVSYLLFEPPFTRALIRLGHQDAMARQDEIREFFAL